MSICSSFTSLFSSCWNRTKPQPAENLTGTPSCPTVVVEQDQPGSTETAVPAKAPVYVPHSPYGPCTDFTYDDFLKSYNNGTLRIEAKKLPKAAIELIVNQTLAAKNVQLSQVQEARRAKVEQLKRLGITAIELRGCECSAEDFRILGRDGTFSDAIRSITITDDPLAGQKIGILQLFTKLTALHLARSKTEITSESTPAEEESEELLLAIKTHAPEVQTVTFREMTLSPEIFQGVSKLRKLSSISCSFCDGIDNEGIEQLATSCSLTSVHFHKCPEIDDTMCRTLSTMDKVANFGIEGAPISDRAISFISGMSLTDLSVRECKQISDASLAALSKMTDLVDFDGSSTELTNKFAAVPHPKLQSLDLSNCPRVTAAIIPLLAQNAKTLTTLKVAHTGIGEKPESARFLSLLPLTSVDLSGTGITAATINLLPNTTTSVEANDCRGLLDEHLVYDSLGALQRFSLRNSTNDKERLEEAVTDLHRNLPAVKIEV